MNARDAAIASSVAIFSTVKLGLGVLIHIWTVVLAFQLCGFWCSLAALFFPVVSEVLLAARFWTDYGFNFYCVALLAYAGLWVIGWVAVLVIALLEG
jgi:hypothetical protein